MCEKKVIPERKINAYKNRFWFFPEKGGYVTDANRQYVVNENGEKVAIILPIEEYEKMKEDLHDLAIVAERRNEKTIIFEDMKENCKIVFTQSLSSQYTPAHTPQIPQNPPVSRSGILSELPDPLHHTCGQAHS